MSERRAWTWCAVAGVLAFIASWLFGRIPDLKPCGGPVDGLGAILAFEFVRSPADVAALFGAEPCRSALVAAQRTGLLLDGLWFIPAYMAFLMLSAVAAGGRGHRMTAGMALLAGLSDELEGVMLYIILGALPGTQSLIDGLSVTVNLKFALLALATAGVGIQLIAGSRPIAVRALGLGIAIMGGFALLRLAQGQIAGMMLCFAIGWAALLVMAAGQVIGGRRRNRSPAR